MPAIIGRATACASFSAAISYVKDQLGLDQDVFLFEMAGAFLGCTYPTPPRMLLHTEEIVKAYLVQEMLGPRPTSVISRCSPPKAAPPP